MESQYFPFLPIKDMCRETPMGLEHLPGHRVPKPVVPLGKVADVIAVGIHDDVAICLLEAHEHIHHLELALHDEGRVVEEAHCRMSFFEHAMRIFGDVYGSYEGVFGIWRCRESVGNGFDF